MGAIIIFLAFICGFAGLVWATVICVQKGKPHFAWIGWALSFLSAIGGSPFLIIGACRLAKPNSKWARERYANDPIKLERSRMRFPKEAHLMDAIAARRAQDDAARAAEQHELTTSFD